MTTSILILGGLAMFFVGGAAVFSAGAKAVQPTLPSPAEGEGNQPTRRPYLRDLAAGVAFTLLAVCQTTAAVTINLR